MQNTAEAKEMCNEEEGETRFLGRAVALRRLRAGTATDRTVNPAR